MYYFGSILVGVCFGVLRYNRKLRKAAQYNWKKEIPTVLLVTYVSMVLSSTVFSRQVYDGYHYRLMPFWSYVELLEGKTEYLLEIFFNIIMLLPCGVLIPIVTNFDSKKTVLTGFLLSLSIELLQLVFRRGLFEFDDLIHNTLGCFIGYAVYKLAGNCAKKLKQQ
jgi:glycopeptide antibiotics resistance protein